MVNNSFAMWDTDKNFYEFEQKDRTIFVKKGNEVIFQTDLIKLKEVDQNPIRPLIIKNKLVVFNYERGMEIHQIDGDLKTFLPIRAIFCMTHLENKLYLQKRLEIQILNIDTVAVEEKISVQEDMSMERVDDSILFYKFKRNKTYLLSNDQFMELPKFAKDFGILTKVIRRENELIVFYSNRRIDNTNDRYCGVYIYDLQTKRGEFAYELEVSSANGANYFDLMDFSFNQNSDVKIEEGNYFSYLNYVLERFGFFAFIYYTKNKKLNEACSLPCHNKIKEIVELFTAKMKPYPRSNEEYNRLREEMRIAEIQVKDALKEALSKG